ncbi:MAG: DUF4136 domain-containing protein [Bacteroidales bacterium]
MKTIKKIALSCVMLVLFLGVASAQVNSDYDKSYDFSKVKTYKFLGWEKSSDKNITATDKAAILSAFERELEARGLTKVENGKADLAITLFAVVNKGESKSAYTTFTGGYGYHSIGWGWGPGFWGGPGFGTATTDIDTEYYNEGTLVIDFFDTASKKLVYESLIKGEVNDNAAKRASRAPKKIHKVMRKFPIKELRKRK